MKSTQTDATKYRVPLLWDFCSKSKIPYEENPRDLHPLTRDPKERGVPPTKALRQFTGPWSISHMACLRQTRVWLLEKIRRDDLPPNLSNHDHRQAVLIAAFDGIASTFPLWHKTVDFAIFTLVTLLLRLTCGRSKTIMSDFST